MVKQQISFSVKDKGYGEFFPRSKEEVSWEGMVK